MTARMTTATAVGEIVVRPAEPARDAALLQSWLRDPHAAFWQMGDLDVGQVHDYLETIEADPHQAAWLGSVGDASTFFAETYDPAHVLLTDVHDAQPGDLGMHVLVSAPRGRPRHGLTGHVMAAVMRLCFDTLGAQRVVVEPDVRNDAIARKNADAGFRVVRDVPLGDKTARLSVCTRADFAASRLAGGDR
ncbi:GNAT family N-acetyltransferase [Mumia quercus]|uniref:GNAT family N-acetyltransferase n=1 Tax=Mumia quercus TaxID=2976125 RepID=UPI0021CF838E|nr:GNAT family N-acetyltransferase [Mumia quercus]